MPRFMVDGTEVTGVKGASVRIVRSTERRLPLIEWDITLELQNEDSLAVWALAPEGLARLRRCVLTVYHRDDRSAHTWTMWRGRVHSYHETEAANCLRLTIQAELANDELYIEDLVSLYMAVTPGETEATEPWLQDSEATESQLPRPRRRFWAWLLGREE